MSSARWVSIVLLLIANGDCHTLAAQPTPPPAQAAPAARRYRDATEHSPRSVRSGGHRLDWSNKPALYRTYAEATTEKLPPPVALDTSALEAITGTRAKSAAPVPLDLRRLSAILFVSGGIGARLRNGREIRTTAAAGALYPNEAYIVSGTLPELPAGVYHYDPQHERLSRLREGDWRGWLAQAAVDERIARAPATLALTGVLGRSAWKYRERAYRHLYWDGGMRLANALAAADAAGLPAHVMAGFVDHDVDQLLGVDGRSEATLALMTIGTSDMPTASPPASAPPQLPLTPSPPPPDPAAISEALHYHAASQLPDTDAVQRFRSAVFRSRDPRPMSGMLSTLPPPAVARKDGSLDAVVRRRRSTRHFARRPITVAELATVVETSSGAIPADFLSGQASLVETYVIANAVHGLDTGAYYYQRDRRALVPLRSGELRRVAGFLCLEQALAYDASVVIFYLADLETIGRTFGERGYRVAELEAGIIGGRAYLAAYAIGRGATGLTFYDDEVTRSFSPHAAGLEPLLVVAVGVPAKLQSR